MDDLCKKCKMGVVHYLRNKLLSIKYHMKHIDDDKHLIDMETDLINIFKYLEKFENSQRLKDEDY